MPITLLCLVKGNTTANAFPVDIEKDQLVGHLKDAIKEKIDVPANFKAKDLKVWKKEISDDRDDLLSILTLNDGDELLATKKISKYFPDSPPEEHIHVLVSPPEATTASSREQELLEEIASLNEKLSKSEHGM